MNTASELREATFKEFGHETRVQRSPLGTPITVPLASAALSSFCVVTMVFNEYPWFAVAGFVAAYTLFWISRPPEQSLNDDRAEDFARRATRGVFRSD